MKRRTSPPKSQETGQFRVIAGLHRGRKLVFPAVDNLRPTPDRVRETLFNWIFDACPQSRCLDLFAGAGSLGIEALSRGAATCTFIESNRSACQAIESHLSTLNIEGGNVIQASLPSPIAQLDSPYNIIFIDPPYKLDTINHCIEQLQTHDLIANRAWVYIENASNDPSIQLPPEFSLYREKIFGQVRSNLFQYQEIR
ncbi:MAG: 16S rRNA (guanine(966)-N(2))-methyltransferase RsmD [Sinobacterium sp.]|nr:16S rRNA (guanine(966)-N(2))-methyltransferase RsmD [Sinobacterium sp.]